MRLHALRSIARYAWRAQTIYDVHAPLAFRFLGEVIEDQRDFYAFGAIETARRALARDKTTISVDDRGAGSQTAASRERRICDIVSASATPPRFGRYLHKLIDFTAAQNVIELGTNLGIGTAYLATALPAAGKLVSLDADAQLQIRARALVDRLGPTADVRLRRGTFDDLLPAALAELQRVDFAFIDGHHAEEPTRAYFSAIAARCTPRSVVVIDDIHWSPGMTSAWRQIQTTRGVTLTIDLQRWGVVFFDRRVLTPQHLTLIPKRFKPWHMGFFSAPSAAQPG